MDHRLNAAGDSKLFLAEELLTVSVTWIEIHIFFSKKNILICKYETGIHVQLTTEGTMTGIIEMENIMTRMNTIVATFLSREFPFSPPSPPKTFVWFSWRTNGHCAGLSKWRSKRVRCRMILYQIDFPLSSPFLALRWPRSATVFYCWPKESIRFGLLMAEWSNREGYFQMETNGLGWI